MKKCPQGIEGCYCEAQNQPVEHWAQKPSDPASVHTDIGVGELNSQENPFISFHGVELEIDQEDQDNK